MNKKINEIDRLKEKLKIEREKNKQLRENYRVKKREILQELDELKEKIKDILYTGDMK